MGVTVAVMTTSALCDGSATASCRRLAAECLFIFPVKDEERKGVCGGLQVVLCYSARRQASALSQCTARDGGQQDLGCGGRHPRTPGLAYLNESVPVTDDLLARTAPLKPTEVFRFAAHCEEKACRHFDGSRCQLATHIVQILRAVTEAIPACVIRPTCRWYQQEGKAACQRCPQVVTLTFEPSDESQRAAEG